MNNISEEQFNAFEEVRESGMTNMFDVPAVIELADGLLNKKEVLTIMDNYTDLKSKFETMSVIKKISNDPRIKIDYGVADETN